MCRTVFPLLDSIASLISFSHLFPGGQQVDISMSSVVVCLQLLHKFHGKNGVIDVINIVHEGHCQQNELQKRERNEVYFYSSEAELETFYTYIL